MVQLTSGKKKKSPTCPVNELYSGAKKSIPSGWDYKRSCPCKSHFQVEIKRVTVVQLEVTIHVEGGKPLCDKTRKSCFSANAISYIFVARWAQQHSWSVASDGDCLAPCPA